MKFSKKEIKRVSQQVAKLLAQIPVETMPIIEMIDVEGGSFEMGSDEGEDDEKPVHCVTLSSFNIGKYPVTQAQWKAVMGTNPSCFKNCDDCPVETVSWEDIQGFLTKLNEQTGKTYRLPTEAEWEYAARGGNKSQSYKYAGSNTAGDVAWSHENSGNKMHTVGKKKSNELGIYDMSGNVWEWCNDWYGTYSSAAETNPKGPTSGDYRVLRGGSWFNSPADCRVAYRGLNFFASFRYDFFGFRLVCIP